MRWVGPVVAAVVSAFLVDCSPPVLPLGQTQAGQTQAEGTPRSPFAAPSMPSPGPPESGYEPLETNARCERCHQEIAQEHRASFHAKAHVDPIYQRALVIEPMPFCRACHAPEADPRAPVDKALGALGVACTSCHWSGGRVLAAPAVKGRSRDPHRGLEAPPIVRSADFAGPAACAGCHEFEFPDKRLRVRPELMQSTVSEHRNSPFADVSCAQCHMPTHGGAATRHRSHAFSGSRRPGALRSVLEIETRRTRQGLVISVAPGAVGHAVPTGDLFRRLRVEVEQGGADMNVIAVERRFLARHFESKPTAQSLRRIEVRDDRPGGGDVGHRSQALHFVFPGLQASHVLGWRVELERVLHPTPGGDGAAVVVERELIASGRR